MILAGSMLIYYILKYAFLLLFCLRLFEYIFEFTDNIFQTISQILELAKNVTGHTNESLVIENFKSLLTSRSQYYNEQRFPNNESLEAARKNCRNADSARRLCPKRWKALQLWFDEETRVIY